jgi:hypothetical protein
MKTVSMAALAVLCLTISSSAAPPYDPDEAAPTPGEPFDCAISASDFDGSDFYLTPMTAAQWHFAQGLWVVLPQTPPGMPPGDGGVIITKKGKSDGGWSMTLKGKLCMILPAPKQLLELFRQVKAGPGEDM